MKLSEKLDELAGANSSWTASAAAAFLDAMELAKEYEAETEKRIAELESQERRDYLHQELWKWEGLGHYIRGRDAKIVSHEENRKKVTDVVDGLRKRIAELEHEVRVAWDTEDPIVCGLVQCSASALEIGRVQYRKATERYAECLKEDNWPSPYHTKDGMPAVVGLPDWAANKAWKEIA